MKAAVVTRPGTVLVREVPDLQPGAKDLTIIGSFSLAGTFPEALTLLASGRIKTAPLVSHRLPLKGLAEFLTRDRRAVREDSIKVLIEPGT